MAKQKITIIRAIPDDIYDIRQVQRATWLDTYPNSKYGITKKDVESRFKDDNTQEGKQKLEQKKKRFYKPNIRTWVAKDQDKIVSFCSAVKKKNHNRILAIYILPQYQSKGVGSRLLSQGLSWLGDKKDIYVNTVSYNLKAIKFYEKHKFIKTGKKVCDSAAKLPSGKILPEIEMVRKESQ